MPRAEEVSRAAQVEVAFRDLEAIRALHQCVDARLTRLGQPRRRDQHTGGRASAATDTTSQLVQLREAEPFGVFDDHHGGVRHVDADFHDGRRDQHVHVSPRKRGHHPLLLVLLQPTVQQRDDVLGKHLRLQVFRHRRGGAQVDLLGVLDEWIDHVGLAPRFDGFTHQRIDLFATRLAFRHRADRLASRRQVANGRHVEVAEGRQRECPWNRRRGHHEHVRAGALRTQCRPLHHAEPVLFVDDHQPQFAERHVLLDERMRTHHEIDRAARDLGAHAAATRRGHASREGGNAEPRLVERTPDGQVVLVGEDFGRRHERHLQPVLHRHQCRDERHHRLARSDVALEQAIHRLRPLHVLDDVAQGRLLSGGQLERQHLPRRVADPIVDDDRPCLALAAVARAPQAHTGLEQEKLLENQPLLGLRPELVQRLERRIGRRKMRGHERLTARHQATRLAHRRRNGVEHVLGQVRQHAVKERALDARRERSGLLVHRNDARRVHGRIRIVGVIAQHLVVRIADLQALAELHRAVQHDRLARMKHVLQERLVGEDRPRRPARIAHDEFEQAEAGTTRGTDAGGDDLADDRHRLARANGRHGDDFGAVLVPTRQTQQQILDRVHPDALKIGGAPRPDATEKLQGCAEQVGRHS